MKKIMSIPKWMTIGLICLLLLIPGYGKATPNDIGFISNCYQKVYFGANGVTKNIKLLYFGGSPVFSYQSIMGTDLNYFTVRPYNATTGVTGPYIGVTGHPNYADIPDGYGGLIRIYRNDQPTITLPDGQSVIVDFYTASYMRSVSITVDFVGMNEAFKIQPIFQSCFTYENFQFKNDLVKLEGFCGELEGFKLKLQGGTSNTMGLPTDFSRDITVPSVTSGAIASDPVTIPETQCDNTICPSYWSNTCFCMVSDPCGCVNFNIEFKLKPCPNTSMICATETMVSLPIQICCDCGYKGPEGGSPTGAGRNTDNAALTGQSGTLSIFPNPNHTGKLEINAPTSPVKEIVIYAVDGRLVKELNVPDLNKVSVDISGLKPGMYQVKVVDEANNISNQKLVVE